MLRELWKECNASSLFLLPNIKTQMIIPVNVISHLMKFGLEGVYFWDEHLNTIEHTNSVLCVFNEFPEILTKAKSYKHHYVKGDKVVVVFELLKEINNIFVSGEFSQLSQRTVLKGNPFLRYYNQVVNKDKKLLKKLQDVLGTTKINEYYHGFEHKKEVYTNQVIDYQKVLKILEKVVR